MNDKEQRDAVEGVVMMTLLIALGTIIYIIVPDHPVDDPTPIEDTGLPILWDGATIP